VDTVAVEAVVDTVAVEAVVDTVAVEAVVDEMIAEATLMIVADAIGNSPILTKNKLIDKESHILKYLIKGI
jgi:hypothetical protein